MDWKDPTEEEKRAIHDPSDLPVIAIINKLSPEDRKLIYDSIAVKESYAGDFEEFQLPWIRDFKHYWVENHNHIDPEVNSAAFSTDFIQSHEYERFRLYYAAKYPERIRVEHAENRKALEFLVDVETAVAISKLISALPPRK